jgi:hypothetical protein
LPRREHIDLAHLRDGIDTRRATAHLAMREAMASDEALDDD